MWLKIIGMLILLLVVILIVDIFFIDKIQNKKIKKVVKAIFSIFYWICTWFIFDYFGAFPQISKEQMDKNAHSVVMYILQIVIGLFIIAGLFLKHKSNNKPEENKEP
jgi:amino acid transporter